MRKTIYSLYNSNKYICDNLERIKPDDIDFYTSNIFKGLRDFVEIVVVKLSGSEEYSHNIFNSVKSNVFSNGKYKFLKNFHQLLQKSMSHYTEVGENSTRLIFKYYEYLLKIKQLLKTEYNIDVLNGIEIIEKMINEDRDLKAYYKNIVEVINNPTGYRKSLSFDDVYYIDRVKPFFIEQEIYYEITFRIANDFTSKFDRVIAFTKNEIVSNYAVKFKIEEDFIELFDKVIPIKIVTDYEVSIRPCEFNNLYLIVFGVNGRISRTNEYKNLMNYIKYSKLNLFDIVLLNGQKYSQFKSVLANSSKSFNISDLLDKCREITTHEKQGSNILRYLLFTMNNSVIKRQSYQEANNILSDLYIKYSTIPFDKLPYSFFSTQHTPRLIDIFQCIDSQDREDELFARFIRNNIEMKGALYTEKSDIKSFENVDNLISTYNNKLYYKHRPNAELRVDKSQIYIYEYEETTKKIIEILIDKSKRYIQGYKESVEAWLSDKGEYIDDELKKDALMNMFNKSIVSLVYGSAGTGKTKLIEYIADYFKERNKNISMLFLANTHTAVNNLKRRVGNVASATFGTVKRYSNRELQTDVLIIDECSTISNNDMLAILKKINFKVIVLVGDIYQIESIRFGNWFYLVKKFLPDIVVELTETRRTKNKELLDFWNAVRNQEVTIEERISRNNYASSLDKTIFQREDEDEIILCLNYSGLYGINNINMLLQQSNPNHEIRWGVHTFKINDPVLFNEISRFNSVLYNNLKGIIRDIKIIYNEEGIEKSIIFDIEIEEVLTDFDVAGTDIELVETREHSSIVRFTVNKIGSLDEDSSELKDDIIPFQIAYAVSIHKSQGLEYNSVKIIITDEIEDRITHSIFYTAITRAKEKLKIYWSPQTQKEILSNISYKFNDKDFYLLKSKLERNKDAN